jgi:GTP-binding protein
MEQDLELKRWLEFHNRRYIVIATKTDKLKSQNQQRLQTAAIRSQSMDSEPLPFSAPTCRGVREIWQAITKIQNKQQ